MEFLIFKIQERFNTYSYFELTRCALTTLPLKTNPEKLFQMLNLNFKFKNHKPIATKTKFLTGVQVTHLFFLHMKLKLYSDSNSV